MTARRRPASARASTGAALVVTSIAAAATIPSIAAAAAFSFYLSSPSSQIVRHPRRCSSNGGGSSSSFFAPPLGAAASSLRSPVLFSSSSPADAVEGDYADWEQSLWEKLALSISGEGEGHDDDNMTPEEKRQLTHLSTLLRVGVPSLGAGALAALAFPSMSLGLASLVADAGAFAVLSQDSSQFVQNFLTVSSLLFSILVGQTYYFMYSQQEAVYYALFAEVTEAKSLLEQVALVCQGRAMYSQILRSISAYVTDDLKRLDADPARLLSSRPADDPLESIMYMTSVGVPGSVYETVRSLRQARAARLGALQRKLPRVHMNLLWLLAATELCSFPLLGAGTQTLGGYNILTVEACLFGLMTVGIVMTLRVVGELWRPAGGAYNVDAVLAVMVSGLEAELDDRLSGRRAATRAAPTPQFRTPEGEEAVARVSAAHHQATVMAVGATTTTELDGAGR